MSKQHARLKIHKYLSSEILHGTRLDTCADSLKPRSNWGLAPTSARCLSPNLANHLRFHTSAFSALAHTLHKCLAWQTLQATRLPLFLARNVSEGS